MKARTLAALAAAGAGITAGSAAAAPPILYHVSHRTPVPELHAKTWGTHAAFRAAVSRDTSLYIVSQQRPRHFDARFGDRWGQVLAVRDGSGRYVIETQDGDPVYLPNGHRDMTIRPEILYRLARNRMTRHPTPPAMLVIDEITANTADEIATFLHHVNRDHLAGDPVATMLRERLAFFVVGGDEVRPQSFPSVVKRFLRNNRSPVYAELYGGKLRPGRGIADVNARMRGYAVKRMQRLGWNVRPMVSGKPKHIGTSRAAIKNLKRRADAVIRNTGLKPAFWHINGGRSPAARGMARMILRISKPGYRPPRLSRKVQTQVHSILVQLHRQRRAMR